MPQPLYHAVALADEPAFECLRIWSADLDALPDPAACFAALDAAERIRAAAFRFDLHRARFIRRRWLLRRILADQLGVNPAGLRFRAEPLGRPSLIAPADAGLSFSTSHADGRALVAVRPGGDVGIDIARIDASTVPGAAAVFMSPRELARWRALPPHESIPAFFRLWTRKEACLKAAGSGLARDPRTVEAWDTDAAAEPSTSTSGTPWPAAKWRTLDLDLGPAWSGAVAIPCPA